MSRRSEMCPCLYRTLIRVFRPRSTGEQEAEEEVGVALENEGADPCFGCGPGNPRGLLGLFGRLRHRCKDARCEPVVEFVWEWSAIQLWGGAISPSATWWSALHCYAGGVETCGPMDRGGMEVDREQSFQCTLLVAFS